MRTDVNDEQWGWTDWKSPRKNRMCLILSPRQITRSMFNNFKYHAVPIILIYLYCSCYLCANAVFILWLHHVLVYVFFRSFTWFFLYSVRGGCHWLRRILWALERYNTKHTYSFITDKNRSRFVLIASSRRCSDVVRYKQSTFLARCFPFEEIFFHFT